MTRIAKMSLLAAAGAATLSVLALAHGSASADTVIVPVGTAIPIRFETAISTASSRAGDLVVARVREDVRIDERVAIPAGSEVRGTVVGARRAGKVEGTARLSVRFDSVEIGGRRHSLDSPALTLVGRKTTGRDAATVGVGTGAGVVVGALLDGGDGAKKGALIGAAAGGGTVLATRGPDVAFPAGARYRLRLASPLPVR
ncbi:MAG: hypothetical protein NDJ94_10365 [Vicinamibacteria bacterium]|nr:hypothetical protein [Vicinamibacteria bacterium]